MLKDHPLRIAVHDEVHKRPAMAVRCPSRVATLTLHGASPDDYRKFFGATLHALALPAMPETATHWQCMHQGLDIYWSLHTEFARLTLVKGGLQTNECDSRAPQVAGDFRANILAELPADILAHLPGTVLYACTALVLAPEMAPVQLTAASQIWFDGQTLVGARVASGKALLLSDLKRHEDAHVQGGVSRLVLINQGAGRHLLGRALHDFFELESYRLMSLLALPLATQLMPEVAAMENRLQQITKEIAAGSDPEHVQTQLNQVVEVLEDAIASSHFRFSATRAYAAMMSKRLQQLHEEALDGVVPFAAFMERRTSPAFATVESLRARLQELSGHLQRSAELLRTRIELKLMKQNQRLLATLNKRASLQLRLQQTVEGLSVVVLTYYLAGLLHYLVDGVAHSGLPLNTHLITALSIPLLVIVLAWRLRVFRNNFLAKEKRML